MYNVQKFFGERRRVGARIMLFICFLHLSSVLNISAKQTQYTIQTIVTDELKV